MSRRSFNRCPVTYGGNLIKKYGLENARKRFENAVRKYNGDGWVESSLETFDQLCPLVASGELEIVDADNEPVPQSVLMDVLVGKIPSNADKPGKARDVILAMVESPTPVKQ
jgi:hypothetical protein